MSKQTYLVIRQDDARSLLGLGAEEVETPTLLGAVRNAQDLADEDSHPYLVMQVVRTVNPTIHKHQEEE